MYGEYFERLHRQEARHAEWRTLDAALTQSSHEGSQMVERLRVAVGHWLIQLGAHLSHERVICLNKQ
jgi:hypothetical protein